jgi:hypothetical protein
MPMIIGAASFCTAVVILTCRHFAAMPVSQTATCTTAGVSHMVSIQDGKLSTTVVYGKLCDTLTIVNEDVRPRLIAFGETNQLITYDGIQEQQLMASQGLTVTLDKIGTYIFRDEGDTTVRGMFTVAR